MNKFKKAKQTLLWIFGAAQRPRKPTTKQLIDEIHAKLEPEFRERAYRRGTERANARIAKYLKTRD